MSSKYVFYSDYGIQLCQSRGKPWWHHSADETCTVGTTTKEIKVNLSTTSQGYEEKLESVFEVPKESRTLKLKTKQPTFIGDLVVTALEYLNSQDYYTRIEFKYNKNYIVVAKLKDIGDSA